MTQKNDEETLRKKKVKSLPHKSPASKGPRNNALKKEKNN